MKFYKLLSIFIFIVGIGFVNAETKTITVTHKYTMGDNDSRNDARDICFLQAKKKCIEQVGVYVQSHFNSTYTESDSGMKSIRKQQIDSYTAALVQAEIVDEKFYSSNESLILELIVKSEIDFDDLEKQFNKIKEDPKLQKVVEKQQNEIQGLQNQINNLSEMLNSNSNQNNNVGSLRTDRKNAINSLGSLEQKKQQILLKMKARVTKRKQIVSLIEIGMSENDVKELLGEPTKSKFDYYVYENVRIYFHNGFVEALEKEDCTKTYDSHSLSSNCRLK